MNPRGLLIALLLTGAAVHAAEEGNSLEPIGSLAIVNVHMLGSESGVADVLVNVLILDGKLKILTENEIPPGTVKMTVDGLEGYLFGSLAIGAVPQFVILDEDPRVDIDVLLDTAKHAVFALKSGVVVLNDLPTLREPDAELPETGRWQAYAAPPIAMPLRYYDGRKWNQFESRWISGLVNGALVLDRLEWISQDEESREQVGDLEATGGGEIRAFRLGVVGRIKFPRPWVYTVYVATSAFDKGFDSEKGDGLVWFDYRLDIPLHEKLNLSIGKLKEPISMERLLPLTHLPWQERSMASDTLLQARDLGVVLNGSMGQQRWTWAASIFKNFVDLDTSFRETPTKYVGRLTWIPYLSADESSLVHLGAAFRHTSTADVRRYRSLPEFDQSPIFMDTGDITVEGEITTNFEAYWRRGPFWFGSEYTRTELDAPTVGNPTFSGFHLTGSWALTGEMRGYRKANGVFSALPVSRSVTHGGNGAWEMALRYSFMDLDDAGIQAGEMGVYSLGLNWWLTAASQLSINYRYSELQRLRETGRASGMNMRLILVLE